MMAFRRLKQNIIDNILAPAEGDRYITVGYQRQRESADVINQNRQVTIYYSEGEIAKGSGQAYGKVMHDISFKVELAVVSPAEADLSVLNDDTATANEKATALRQMSEAGVLADEQMDDLIEIVFQVLMDARNANMGFPVDPEHPKRMQVSSRWVDQINKDTPIPDGEYVMLTGSLRLTCRVEETIVGDDLVEPGNKIFESDLDLSGDEISKQGVEVTAT